MNSTLRYSTAADSRLANDVKLNVVACERTKATRPDFNVVIVYDDSHAAIRAMNVLSGLVRQFGDDFEFRCDLWRFDVLALPKACEAAALAGDAADVLIVSAQCDTDLPPPVKDWLDQSVAEKTPGSAALVALLESHQRLSDVQCRTRQFLQSAADRSLIDFFLHEVDLPPSGLGSAPEDLQRRANTAPGSKASFTAASRLRARRRKSDRRCKRTLSNPPGRDQMP